MLARHGWNSLLRRLGLAEWFHVRGAGVGEAPVPIEVRRTLEELGPTFIKFGQLLSTRPDVVPPEYVTELAHLQDDAPRIPLELVQSVIEEEFGQPAEELFDAFDPVPIAAASLGQTHAAVLKDGREVVVKVQRPGIRQGIETDLEIIAGVARILDRYSDQIRALNLPDVVEEFAITLRQELDYTREGRNGDALKEHFVETNHVRVAGTIWDYTTSRVLTSERIHGVKITDLSRIESLGLDVKEIARNLWRAYLKMVFLDGFFHGDPHPGNLIVLEDNVIGFLDYGLMGRLDREMRRYVTMLLTQYVQQDSGAFADTLLAMGAPPPELDRKQFAREIDRLLRQYYGAAVGEVGIGEALSRALNISTRHRIRLPASLALLAKVVLGVEGITTFLYPDYDMAAEARPFISRAMLGEFSPSVLGTDLLQAFMSWKSLLLSFPQRSTRVLDRMAEGSFRIVFRHEGLENPIKDIDKSANRLSFAILASASIVGSSLILSANVGPDWQGYSVIGLAGFVISFLSAVWLVISIIRANKMW
ncbi:MAG: ABC1 kinase family protein [Armatimonadota bacterium]